MTKESQFSAGREMLPMTYTPEQVAKIYHRSVATVNRWVRQGRITAINTGGNRKGPYVFRPEDLEEYNRRWTTGSNETGA